MISNYLKVAFRNLLKHRIYSAITIVGFAIGLAAAILIALYVRFELSFDDFQVHGDTIVRASFASKKEGIVQGRGPSFTPPFAPAAANEIPEVESFVRLSTPRVAYAFVGGESFKLENIRHADSTFFDIFSFNLIAGDIRSALRNPYSLVLSQSSAERMFGEGNPLGTLVKLDGKGPYQITGIVADPPANSSIQFSSLISFSTLYEDKNLYLDWNGGNQYIAYLQLVPNADIALVEKQCSALLWRYLNQQLSAIGVEVVPSLEPLKSVHLFHEYDSETRRNNIAIVSAVAVFILILACVNFVNLTTARAIRRAKEVGIRKTFGANRNDLVSQFLGEALLVTIAGTSIAILLVELVTPWYRALVGEHAGSLSSFEFGEAAMFVFSIFTVGIAAGSYPAFHLSRFQPAAIQGEISRGGARSIVRNILVIFQFAVSITLIACTLLVGAQLQYMQNKDLGFRQDNMIVIPLRGEESKERGDILKQELTGLPDITGVTASSEVPSAGFTTNGYFPEGQTTPVMIHVVDADERFFDTYGLAVIKGRSFSSERLTDKDSYLINESLALMLGWDDPIGKTIRRGGDHTIIGVVKDFHYATLHDKIEPLIITNQPWRDRYSVLSVRTESKDIPELIISLKAVWHRVLPSTPFEFSFLDDQMDTLYRAERRFEGLFFSFSFLAIVIALMGLVGLASFSAQQRTKEIGIRKVLGASVQGVVSLLSADFIKLIAVANLLAWPTAYYFTQRWLDNFAYRMEMPWSAFILAGGSVLLLAVGVIGVQAIKAASANPVDALRYE
ncbi:MAG: ABC transporter permease [Bacteroidota bacterium]